MLCDRLNSKLNSPESLCTAQPLCGDGDSSYLDSVLSLKPLPYKSLHKILDSI